MAKPKSEKKLVPLNVRLPLDVIVFLVAEKERTAIAKERLVLNALLEYYPIRKP